MRHRYPTYEQSCASAPTSVFWHKDNEMKPHQVFKYSGIEYKWNCFDCGHVYEQSPSAKNGQQQICPFCTNKKLCEYPDCQSCFQKSCASIPENVELWHSSNKLSPRQVFKRTTSQYKWNCFNCNHTYDQSPDNKNGNKKKCPFCANQKLCENPDCQTCFQKSCASISENVKLWHLSNKLTPRQIFKSSDKKQKWNCFACNHTYDQAPSTKNGKGKCGCPYCVNTRLCDNECKTCFEKSCASVPENVKLWHASNKLTPRQVYKFSYTKYKWNCFVCNHTYQQSPANKNKKGRGCLYCSNKELCKKKNCDFCFNKSCESLPENKKLWHPDNKSTARQVFKFSNKKYKWNCFVCNNAYDQSPANKNGKNSGCPSCKHKTEKKIHDLLKSENIKIKREFKLQGCTKKYDFLLIDFQLIIECDGNQHIQDHSHFKSTAKQNQDNDIAKMKKAMSQNYSFIRLYQPDILLNKINWQQIIKDNLFKRKTPTVNYHSKDLNLYNAHKLLMNQIL